MQHRVVVDSPVSPVNVNINKELMKRKSLDRKDFEVRPEPRMNSAHGSSVFLKNPNFTSGFVFSKPKLPDDSNIKQSVVSSLIKPRFQHARFSIGKDNVNLAQNPQLAQTDGSRLNHGTVSVSLGRKDTQSFQEQQMSSSRLSKEGRRTPSKSNVLIRYRQTSEAADNSYSKGETDPHHGSLPFP